MSLVEAFLGFFSRISIELWHRLEARPEYLLIRTSFAALYLR
jgi:hypothetical protein